MNMRKVSYFMLSKSKGERGGNQHLMNLLYTYRQQTFKVGIFYRPFIDEETNAQRG